jgi:hypothetical protein
MAVRPARLLLQGRGSGSGGPSRAAPTHPRPLRRDRWVMMGAIGVTTGFVGYCLYLVGPWLPLVLPGAAWCCLALPGAAWRWLPVAGWCCLMLAT